MDYFSFNLDSSQTTLEDKYPEAQHETFLEFMHALSDGKAFPSGQICPVEMQIGSDNEKPSDAGLLSGSPALSPRAQSIINSVAADQVQFIPIHHKPNPESKYQVEETYAWLNVLNRVSCLEFIYGETLARRPKLDVDQSKWIPRDPAPIIKEIRFYPEKVEGLHIFRPHEWSPAMVISSVLHEAMVNVGLTGLAYEPMEEWLVKIRKVENKSEGFYPGVS